MEAAANSFKIGFLTAGLATVLGTAAAYGLVRGRSRRKEALYAFFISPMIVPNIVFALALYYLFSRLRMVGNMWSLVLGHTVLALPPVIIVLSASLQSEEVDGRFPRRRQWPGQTTRSIETLSVPATAARPLDRTSQAHAP